MKSFYLLTGSVFSFVYLICGILMLIDKFPFHFEPDTRIGIGCVLVAYGSFRIYIFYNRIRSNRENENT